jgi:hypothetical protein
MTYVTDSAVKLLISGETCVYLGIVVIRDCEALCTCTTRDTATIVDYSERFVSDTVV